MKHQSRKVGVRVKVRVRVTGLGLGYKQLELSDKTMDFFATKSRQLWTLGLLDYSTLHNDVWCIGRNKELVCFAFL